MKYDFLLKDGEPVLSEFDYIMATDRVISSSEWPGTWNRALEWIGGYKRLAECQVEVFLQRVKSTGTESVLGPQMNAEGLS